MSDLDRIEGLFVGQLNAEELEIFLRAVKEGKASRHYSGGPGFMGLARVRVHR
jgi:hypothetical protein